MPTLPPLKAGRGWVLLPLRQRIETYGLFARFIGPIL
jgi:hypothetical protein